MSAGKIEYGQKPAGLNWDAWLGPAAERPYLENVHPFRWRGWVDFGTGQLGDWFCHNADGAVWALKLDEAETVEVESDTPPDRHSFNPTGHFIWRFPARAGMPPVKLVWRHGRNSALAPDADVPPEYLRSSAIYIGDKGMAVSGSWMKGVRLVPEAFQKEVGRPEKMIPRVDGIANDFFNCIRNGGQPCSNFVYAGRLTEIMHLGNIAARVGEKLVYNFKTGTFVNSPQADALMTRKPRKGWEFGYI
jgi:predicted dehydrogenase